MSELALRPEMSLTVGRVELALPRLIAETGTSGAKRFVEFFTATIRNPNTREAYGRGV